MTDKPEYRGLAAELFRRHPIERVTLTDKDPFSDDQPGWAWTKPWGPNPEFELQTHWVVPGYLFDLLPKTWDCRIWYSARQTALDDLSSACVRFGRAAANLPEPVGATA